ncbi:hypothetical protein Taro_000858 [Colocasia esculenta]|uniref:K-box domain-containing protein n=1 Tax=Colocasia esculenta TaxID=4460 RepID=A0A843TD54_COLES|nr:hypothetical protein [Colocasia esculenta]
MFPRGTLAAAKEASSAGPRGILTATFDGPRGILAATFDGPHGIIAVAEEAPAAAEEVCFAGQGLLRKPFSLANMVSSRQLRKLIALVVPVGWRLLLPKTIERYLKQTKNVNTNNVSAAQNMPEWKDESAGMVKKIEHLQDYKRKITGENLGSCSAEELHEIEGQLELSLRNVRERKNQLFTEQITLLKEKEKMLMEENSSLVEKIQQHQPKPSETVTFENDDENTEVETELYIGRPGTGRSTQHCTIIRKEN